MNEATGERGTCKECRHANQGTMDTEDGFWACPWVGSVDPHGHCQIKYKETGRYVFEPFDGANCTWGTGDSDWRTAPLGYADKEIIPA